MFANILSIFPSFHAFDHRAQQNLFLFLLHRPERHLECCFFRGYEYFYPEQNGQARLLKEGKKIDVSSYGLSLKQQSDFLKLTFVAEESLGNKRIMDWVHFMHSTTAHNKTFLSFSCAVESATWNVVFFEDMNIFTQNTGIFF
jgi:hypothetical protein